jgi:predicted dehydrogenase
MEKVRIGFVGVGAMGQCAHLKNFAVVPGCEVVAIAEIREKLGEMVARKYGVPNVYKNHTEMLAAEKLDAIVASQPFTRHGVLVPDLLKAGIPILTEKPLAGSVRVGEKIIKAVSESGTWHMLGYHKRSDPAVMYAKATINALKETGELGPMRYVRILMPEGDWIANGFADLVKCDDLQPELEFDPAAEDMDEATYKLYISFVNYYIHQVNMMRHILGEPYEVTYADPSQVVMGVRSSSGISGTIEMSPYRTTIDWQESILVCFKYGYVKINLPAPLAARPGTVEIFKDPGNGATPQTIIPQLPNIPAMRQQAANFISAVKGEMEPLCNSLEALDDLKVARDYIKLLKGV